MRRAARSDSGKIRAMSKAIVILCTCPDERTAEALARGLVREHLAACVNVLPGIRSIYRWQDSIEEEAEVLLMIKSVSDRLSSLEAWLQTEHPYEVPEIVALPTDQVAAPYLEWLSAQVKRPVEE
jgi:periplasmic divalent cation tolerance protein